MYVIPTVAPAAYLRGDVGPLPDELGLSAELRQRGPLSLFAAVAALYGDSAAPRLIMLDEALSGIDDDPRERVLACHRRVRLGTSS